jgi:hypothetical protein
MSCTKAHIWKVDECLLCKIQELEKTIKEQQEELEDVKASNRLKQGHINYIPTLRENYEKQIKRLKMDKEDMYQIATRGHFLDSDWEEFKKSFEG